MTDFLGLAGFVVVCLLAALSGAYFRPGAWYRTLPKPSWTPPNWLFPVAWSILYLLIAVAGWLVWRAAGFSGAGLALGIYGLHLVFNALWSALFFGARRIDLAFVDVVAMWLSLAGTIALFAPIDPLAAALLAPYLAWVTFAGALNLDIWRRSTTGD
jgi:tryptophan-rich sensory protein